MYFQAYYFKRAHKKEHIYLQKDYNWTKPEIAKENLLSKTAWQFRISWKFVEFHKRALLTLEKPIVCFMFAQG